MIHSQNNTYPETKEVTGMSTKISLRPYQEEFIGKIREQFKKGKRRVCGVMPCGSGKTITTGWMARETAQKGNRVVFMVHRQELIEQTSAAFYDLGIEHGIIAADSEKNYDLPVQVASVQTLVRRLGVVPRADFLICDECHHILASSYKKIVDTWQPFLLGVTATPERRGGVRLGDVFDSMVVGPSVTYLIGQGNLTQFDYYAPPTTIDFKKLRTDNFGEFRTDDMLDQMDKQDIIGDVVKYYNKYAAGKQAIVYCVNVKHSEHTAEMFNEAGIPAAHVDGETPKDRRRMIIEDFRSGYVKVLCLFGEGFDVPNCETVILTRPTKSLTLYIQQAMRSMRPDPNNPKKKAVIIDHVQNYKRFGLIDVDRNWSLDPNLKKKKKEEEEEAPTKTCPQCNAVLSLGARVCPTCGYKFPRQEIENKKDGVVEKIYDSSTDTNQQDVRLENKIIDKPTTIEEFLIIAQRKGYKQYWAAMQALNHAKSLEDCQHIAEVCDYKKGWGYHKWQEIKETVAFTEAWQNKKPITAMFA